MPVECSTFAMRVSANSLSAWIWLDIIKYLDTMDDTVSLAMVNVYFYRIVGMDFKKICYEHVIFRQKGETWAYAYKNAGTNVNKTMFVKYSFHDKHAVCCPFTGKMAIKLDHGYLLLTNIDFGLKELTILDFTSYTDQITHVNMINGKEILVRTPFFTLVFDLHSMKTDKRHDICEWRQGMKVYVISENDSLFIKDQFYNDRKLKIPGAKCEIYSMKRQKFQPVELDEGCYWDTFNYSTLFNRKTQKFLVYNKHNYEWIRVQAKPELLIVHRWLESGLFLNPLSPFNIVLCKYGNTDTLARHFFIQFKKNDVCMKHFKAILNYWDMTRGINDFKVQNKHQIEKLMNMKFPVPKESSADFYDWFVQLHVANDNVPLIDAKTSATKYFNFYSLKPNEK
ncbi:unnamed protein product [Bursaphelenchus okinawaensis]|uniref:Uncharacterized protein n=1 Tax=Bursaphelenchus okinawaensis TaxID=465554 RepID=A0A811KX15_9BILA|nr:unnamed protein product [Bursaphelenchus okinawaensis]CAG9113591.1 unnamed protein product [Bursaphelenchus okinawaensis]